MIATRPRHPVAAAAALALLFGAGCSDDGPDRVTSETAAPESADTITLRQGVPHWLDDARERSLAIMSISTDPVRADIGYLVDGENDVHTLGIDDTIDVEGKTWRVVEITPGDAEAAPGDGGGSVELAEAEAG
ncbi:hypothetical protein CLV30_12352 [Haloactinopolyspora alba]|uniref:Uncharacterized protein n=1 Tax=Haloactinopolyspora alba TaxID=648780 RepID=A0A2P8DJ53_9ACTN|nr:DUF6406 domain-containing protein [Haloactinopolyspora alba]PSK97253.1 hypothetical protein CLV30_12352 [Haloactinopolyspora alba]